VSGRGDSSNPVPWLRGTAAAVAAVVGVVGIGLVRNVAAARPGVNDVARVATRLPGADAVASVAAVPAKVEPLAPPDVEPSVDATLPAANAVGALDAAVDSVATSQPACRAAVLVHGGGYFMGDHDTMKADFADPLRAAGFNVDSVDYPLLGEYPTIKIDPAHSWYPRNDLTSAPAPMRFVHDRLEFFQTGKRLVHHFAVRLEVEAPCRGHLHVVGTVMGQLADTRAQRASSIRDYVRL